jgi:hypothetical protein
MFSASQFMRPFSDGWFRCRKIDGGILLPGSPELNPAKIEVALREFCYD